MEYCNQCGELVEGRFCRMCGAPTAVAAAQAAVPAAGAQAGYGDVQGPGYGLPAAPAPAVEAEATQYLAAGSLYQPEGTPAEFDGFFRSADGAPSPHSHTQLLPPVPGDYRMDPPGGSPVPPQGLGLEYPERDEDAEDARHHRMLMYGTLGAVFFAAAIILGMLYLGGNGNPVSNASGTTAGSSTGPSPSATSTDNGTIVVPTQSAGTIPSSSAPTTSAPAAGGFSGDSLPLGPGSQGTMVTYVQRRLQELGYYHGPVSGTFDQATALAVQQFQAAAGVSGDAASTVGQHTLVALIAAGDTPDLHTGSKAPAVSRLDQALNAALGTHIQVSNRYTAATTGDVMRYQSAVGLPPTGQVDGATWAKLQSGAL
jgi:peptidoglycan hydrolase-like protein with peptidoglycan-binding domain